MERESEATARAVMHVLADLAPSAEQAASGLTIPTEWFRWLPAKAASLFAPRPPLAEIGVLGNRHIPPTLAIDPEIGNRLAAIDHLRARGHSLRVGWLFVAGRFTLANGQRRRVFQPLVTLPVRIGHGQSHNSPTILRVGDIETADYRRPSIHQAGDAELTELVTSLARRDQFEKRLEYGAGALDDIDYPTIPPDLLAQLTELTSFARDVAAAAGLPAHDIEPADMGPDQLDRSFQHLEGDHLRIIAGAAIYTTHQTGGLGRAASLRALAAEAIDRRSAFHSLYVAADDSDDSAPEDDEPVESPYVLTPVQRTAVQRSRRDPVTLISGAPGTGKSHTVAAIACDALARGQTVLLAAKSDATVDALLDLLDRAPGPDPVVFGSNERRDALATRLAAGQLEGVEEDAVGAAAKRLRTAIARRDTLRRSIVDRLAAEALLIDGDSDEVVAARATAPDLFDPTTDLAEADRLLAAARTPAKGWWSRRRRRKRHRALIRRAGALPDATVEEIAAALAAARAHRGTADLVAADGLAIGDGWDDLLDLEDAARDATARWLAADSRSSRRLRRSTLQQIAVLATALRSGRAARRAQLRRLDHAALTRGLPLWAGTLADIDDLLPPVPALFDLVILDEASSIDQPLAAAALVRGARAVVVGDPRQLRHVSFVSDERSSAVVEEHGLGHLPRLAALLDVRRNSLFDVAVGVAPVLVLDEHFRSAPHLMDFVAERLYDGRVRLATRSPATESKDCVEVVRHDAPRNKAGVVRAEVDWIVAALAQLRKDGATSVGVVTPFRAQADAIEAAVLDSRGNGLTLEDIEQLDLRVGTVHAFQGNERDLVIASVGVGSGDAANSWRFVQDPHLFAVFVTRARKQLTCLVSGEPPESGLVADYLAQVDSPPGRPAPVDRVSRWAAEIAGELVRFGLPATTGYPTGRHVLDVCVGDDARSVAIECGVHPDGAEAHVERHLALRRSGWTILEAHRSKWQHRPGELVVELAGAAGHPTRPS